MGETFHSFVAVPVVDSSKEMLGVLIAANVDARKKHRKALERVANDLLISIKNMNSYNSLQRMGSIDMLTN